MVKVIKNTIYPKVITKLLTVLLFIFTFVNQSFPFNSQKEKTMVNSVITLNNTIFVSTVKNFNLSEEEFYHLLNDLKSGETTLFKQIFLSHAQDCISYLQMKYRASYNDAYDAMLDTMIVYRKRLLEDKISYGNLRFLFLQMASQHYHRMMKSEKQHEEIEHIEDSLMSDENTSQYDELQLKNLEKALENMEGDCKEILILNYYKNLKLNDIAEKLGKNYDALRKQKERCVNMLVKIFNSFNDLQ